MRYFENARYYRNGREVEDTAPSCRKTSMKVLAEDVGVYCGRIGDDLVLYSDNKMVSFPGVRGIVDFIYLHFGVLI